MKKQFLYLFGFLALTACTDDEDVFSGGEIAEPVITPENKPNDVVTGDVFAKLNLDYPGLEKVKQHYEADEQYYAALALLDYYRNRNISNPEVDLITPSPTDGEKRMADQALEENGYRFRVGTFVEEGTAGQSDAVYYSFDNGDAGINWNMEPEGTSREFSYQQHRWQWMEAQAETYRSTRNETYIQSWIDVYNSWLNAFPCPNVKFDDPRVNDSDYKNDSYQWKGLQTAERVLTMVNILPYYIYSDNFTPELLTTFLNSFADHVEMVRLNYYSDGNIRITQAQSVATAGILMPEFKNSQEWTNEGCTMLNEAMDQQWLADGVHYELDPSYHISAISDFLSVVSLAEAAQANGSSTPLYGDIVDRLKSSMQFVFDLAYPNYQVDNWNDTRASVYTTSWRNRMREYAALFPEDDEWLYVSWGGSHGGTQPTWTSKAYATSGYYMLRNWGNDPIMMVLKNNYNPDTSWHCQPDNGTFSLWYKGRNFFPDAGCYSYDEGTQRSTYRQSMIHNTVSIQNNNFPESQQLGKMLKHESTSVYDAIVTENLSYPQGMSIGSATMAGNFYHRRTAFFVKSAATPFFVLLDEMHGEPGETNVNNKFNINFHLYAEAGQNVIIDNNPKKSDATIDEAKYAQAHTAFEDGNNLLVKAFAYNEQDFEMTTNKGDVAVSETVGQTTGEVRDWLRINGRKPAGSMNRIITILYPYNGTAVPSTEIKAKFTDAPADVTYPESAAFQVTVGGETFDLSYTL